MKKYTLLFCTILLLGGMVLVTGCDWNESTINTTTASVEGGEDLPTEDALGADMANVERYPDSVRTYYLKDNEETDITYVVKSTAVDVRDYYMDLLEDEDWTLIAEASDYIDFEKGDENNPEMLTVYFEFKKKKKWTEYELVYYPPLTEEELAEWEAMDDEDFSFELE